MNAPARDLRASVLPPPELDRLTASPQLHLVRVPEEAASIWSEPAGAGGAPMTTDRARSITHAAPLEPALEAALVAALTRPIAPGETHHAGAARRERELCALLARLDVAQAFHLGRRLDADLATDPIAVAFRRLVVERRMRLRAFLRDARRRARVSAP